MKRNIFPIVLGTLILVSCRYEKPTPRDTEPGDTAADPQKGDTGPVVADGETPHLFTPRGHAPRSRTVVPRPDFSSMPPLVTRFNACRPKPKRRARPKPPPPLYAPPSPIAVDDLGGIGTGYGGSDGSALRGAGGGGRAGGLGTISSAPKKRKSARPSGGVPRSSADGEYAAPAAEPSRAPAAKPTVQSERRGRRAAETGTRQQGKRRDAPKEVAKLAVDPGKLEAALDEALGQDAEGKDRVDYEAWGAAIYLSNDDTMSLSSAQRVMYAIDRFLPLPPEHIRPHELLNYFAFETGEVQEGNDFSVIADIEEDARQPGIHSLALSVRGRPLDLDSRRNANLTLVLDRSGSMKEEGRMEYLKRGLNRMIDELKLGDMVSIVGFDQKVCVPLENFVVGRDPRGVLERAIESVKLGGSTNLHDGLTRGYDIADRAYRPEYTNRVVLVTDALANTGVTDARTMSLVSRYYDTRRIRLSGIGVGREFNDDLLNRLTERGKGAYVFLGSEKEVDAVFGERFISLIETTANNVRFRLHLPPSLRMNVFYGEESSTVKADVLPIHYYANTTQLFLSDLVARGGSLRPQDFGMLSIEYEDPETGEGLVEEYAFNLGEAQRASFNVRKARVVMAWIDLLALMASRPAVRGYRGVAGGWPDLEGWTRCEDGRGELGRLARGIERDPEVRRVLDLWDRYCARYDRPRNPVRRQVVPRRTGPPSDGWPGAQPGGGSRR